MGKAGTKKEFPSSRRARSEVGRKTNNKKNTTDKQIKAGSLGDTDDGKEAQQGRQVAMDGQASVQKDGKGVYVLWENGSGSRPGP